MLGFILGMWQCVLVADDPFITTQPTNQYRDLGQSGYFRVIAGGTEPLYYQWLKEGMALANGTNISGATNSSLTINRLMETDVGKYTVVVGNQYGSVTSMVARMELNWTTADASFDPGSWGSTACLAIQADGKVLVGGGFLGLGGQSRQYLGRLNVDGTIDSTFNPGANSPVTCLAIQADGKIVVGGYFTILGGQSRQYLGRLNVDGTVDSTFNPGASDSVACLAIQADGKIVVGGSFGSLGGQSRQHLGRLNVDGTVDSAFNPGAGSYVDCLAIQADGKMVVGGNLISLGGQSSQILYLGRLNVDGTVDSTFNPGASWLVSCLAIQADGKIVVGGFFSSLGGQSRQSLGRLNVDGTVDSTFSPGAGGSMLPGTVTSVTCVAMQADGKMVVGGDFRSLGGQSRPGLGRLNVDGTVDSTFNPGANSSVSCLAMQADGKLVVGGAFSILAGQSRSNIGRLNNTGLATQQLNFDETTVVWLRGGSGPEVSRVTFEYLTNGGNWISLGNGVRVPGGWHLTGLSLSTNATIRARGTAVSGGESDWFVEQVLGAPFIAFQPVSIVNNFGSNASFSVTSDGSGHFQYQWFKDGMALTNSGNLSGVTSNCLTITQLSKADEGGYSVLVGNTFGSMTSLVASLMVNDPFITIQPTNQNRELGQTGHFSVVAGGSEPLYYQWLKDALVLANGTNVTGATNSSLTFNRLMETDVGDYTVVVSNQYGSLTSVVASVDINMITADASFNPGAGSSIACLAIQADGKIVVGGSFSSLGGLSRQYLGRLNGDGSVDTTFNPGANNWVNCLAIQADGKIVVGGYFSSLGGQSHQCLGRLNADGSVDSTFNPGASNPVTCLAIQADGKIVVGGYFFSLSGESRQGIGRLNGDGTVDSTFNAGTSWSVTCLAVQPDGKIVVGGEFSNLDGQSRTNIGRLNGDGTADSTFNPGASGTVSCLAIQADGKIVVGGSFSSLGGLSRQNIGRLNGDGTVDSTFNPGASAGVTCLAIQADGKIVVGGSFSSLGGLSPQYLGRLNGDGTVDSTFNPGASASVSCLAIQADGEMVVGGNFSVLGGQPRSYIGRLNNTGLVTHQLSFDETTVVWLRGGPSPEVSRVTFDYSTNGGTWASLGNGDRVSGGWQLAGLSLSTNATIRARGAMVSGGINDWLVEQMVGLPFVISQPTSVAEDVGSPASLTVTAAGSIPLQYQWFKDGEALTEGTNVTGAMNSALTINKLLASDAGDYFLVVSNQYGSVTSAVANIQVNLCTPDTEFNPVASGPVTCLAIQVDGKMVVGGKFTTLGGQPRQRIGRLNVDGTIDSTFNPGTDDYVTCLAMQTDGKIVVGGNFSNMSGQSRQKIGRMNVDGTVDSTFNLTAIGTLNCLAIQADGNILCGGNFSVLGGQLRTNIGRLHPDGSVDSTFNPGASGIVSCLAIQADGKIIVGGNFNSLGGQLRTNIGRLHPDGSVDSTFNPGANSIVSCLAIQADGKIVVGGNFSSLGGQLRQNLGRLNLDGSVDSGFNPGANGIVACLAIQTDGKIVVGGEFSNLDGQSRTNIGRLNGDGTVDSTFNPGANDLVSCLAVQADGKLVVAGNFSALDGQARSFIGRLNNTGLATQSLSFDETTVVWLRGGSSPEFSRVTFEYSTNGDSWASLGNGDRVPGGWQLTGLSLSTNGTIRARGTAVSGGISDWSVEQVIGAPFIAFQPVSIVNNFGSTAFFSVTSYGSAPCQYQWLKNGLVLTNSGNLSGVTTDRLTLTQLSKPDSGGYSVLVSNAFGNLTSLVALLTVNDPFIATQPTNQYRDLGQSSSFNVTAGGTAPVYFQWFKDGIALENGTNVTGVTNALLTINRLMETDVRDYTVVVNNPYGSVTSAVATIQLNLCTPDTGFNPVANDRVTCLAIQADGKILVGGTFTTLGGQSRYHLGRLEADGTVDYAFTPEPRSDVACLAVQADGKILVGGLFSLGRLNVDGAADSTFNPRMSDAVTCLAIQEDGKIVVGSRYAQMARLATNVSRLHPDGTVDDKFIAQTGVNSYVTCLAVQTDGKIVVGGSFKILGGQSCTNIARLNPDGSMDSGFNPGANGNFVNCLAIQADGKIVVGGTFTVLGGQSCKYIARLNPDGSVDSGFNPEAGGEVRCLAMQADGKMVIGGNFGYLGGQYHPSVGRLNVDGSADNTFRPSARGSTIYCLAIQPDGKVIVGGFMNSLSDLPCKNIGRLNDAEPATQQLSCDGSTVNWLRGGTGPDVWRATFECTTNGFDWTLIGNGARVPGGWQLSGVSIPANTMIRARGSAITGGVSDWFVDTTVESIDAAMSLNIDRVGGWPVLHVTGGIGLQYVLEYAPVLSVTNLWQSKLFTLTNSPQVIIDETMTNANQRFYRLRNF